MVIFRHILYLDKNRFSSGYDVEWEIELQSIIGVPALLDEDKKIVITLKVYLFFPIFHVIFCYWQKI